MEPILTIRDLDFHYGEIHALDHVNFDVYPGEIVAMIGSNGAGKTTLLRTISGLLGKNTGGTISFMGKRIDSMPSWTGVGRQISISSFECPGKSDDGGISSKRQKICKRQDGILL